MTQIMSQTLQVALAGSTGRSASFLSLHPAYAQIHTFKISVSLYSFTHLTKSDQDLVFLHLLEFILHVLF